MHSEHRHNATDRKPPGRDLGILGVLIHVIGDALNNIGVIISALVIWLTNYDARFYADPGTSMGIAIMILLSSLPLVKQSGKILMQSAPRGVVVDDVKHDLEKVCLALRDHCLEAATDNQTLLPLPPSHRHPRTAQHFAPTDTLLPDPRHRVSARVAHLASGPEKGHRVGPRRCVR